MKPPLSFEEQVDLLLSRGLQADREQLLDSLKHISYYKLSGYFYIFQDKSNNDNFKTDTDFEEILNLYNFDQELRKILLGYLNIIEISLASQIANHFCNTYNTPTPHLDNNIFYQDKKDKFDSFINSIKNKVNRNEKLEFVKHNINKYKNSENYENLPLWVLIEILDFGDLLSIYKGLKEDIAVNIAKTYGITNIKCFSSIVESLRILRNKSAHNNRVFNTSNYSPIILPHLNQNNILNKDLNNIFNPNKVFLIITVMKYLLDIIKPNNRFKQELEDIINEYKIDVKYMGVIIDWKETNIWKK